MNWKFWQKKRVGFIKCTFVDNGRGQIEFRFQSHIAPEKMKELDRLNDDYRSGMGHMVQHMHQLAAQYATCLGANVDEVNRHYEAERRRGLN